MILRDRIESCLRVLDKYHYVQCTTALPSARCSCGLHLVKSSLRANWHQLEAERDALAADLAAARALLADAEIMLQECEPWLDQYANSAKLKADTQKVRLRIVDALAGGKP